MTRSKYKHTLCRGTGCPVDDDLDIDHWQGSLKQSVWQLYIERQVWMAQSIGRIWAFKCLIYFTKPSKNTNWRRSAPGRPGKQVHGRAREHSGGHLGETSLPRQRARVDMLRAAFPLLLLSLDLVPGSPRSLDEGCSQSLTYSTPEPSCALALRPTASTTSTAGGKHWPPWGQAREGVH